MTETDAWFLAGYAMGALTVVGALCLGFWARHRP